MKKILLAIGLLTFTVPAFAVGTMIVAAYYGIATSAIGATFTAGMYAAAFAINFAVSTIVSRIFAPKAPKARDNGVRQQIPPATVNSLPIIYGDAYAGGVYVDAVLSQNQKTMYHVLAISCISENGQFGFDTTKFYYGDRLITFDSVDQTKVISLTDGAGNVDTKVLDKIFINLYTSTASGIITSSNGAPAPHVVMGYDALNKFTVPSALAWPSSGRQMNGLAFAIVKLVYSLDAGTTSMNPITFHCSHYLNSQGCAKPGDVWLDYIKNSLYGGAVDPAFVDSASATVLNTYSDELITFTPAGGGSATQPRYRINGVLDTGENIISNINKILDACDSWMAYDAAKGQWSIVVNKAEGASFAFNDTNIVSDIRVSAVDINQSINQIEASFPNKLNKDIPAYVNIITPSGLLYPNEPVNKASVQYDLVNNNIQAYYLANRQLEQAREDLIVIFKTTYVGIQVNAGDVISITNTAYGWSNKLFRAVKVNEASLPDGSLGAQIEAHEYNSQVYDNLDINSFSPEPNSGIPDIGYFGTLTAPTVTDQLPNAAVPTFSVDVLIPPNGQITTVSLYYTAVSTPTDSDWILWGNQVTTTSAPFTNGTTLKFPHINLPTGTYYFAVTVGNQLHRSELSPKSSAYSWSPNPSSSAVAATFVPTFSPGSLGVPFDGTTATFTGITPQLYGTTSGGSVDFVAATSDSDSLFVNNSWRIGGSATTGYGDIVASGITIGTPSDAGYYALFPTPTAMSTNPATLSVPVRYKANDGTVYQSATAIQQFIYAVAGDPGTPGTDGNKTAEAYLYQWSTSTPADPNGFSVYTWATASNGSYGGGNGWTTAIPANPGTPSIKLWRATKGITATAATLTTTVDWSAGFSVTDITQNGAAGASGTQSAKPSVFQWAATIPAGPTGTSTYTWAVGSFTPTPSGWTLTPGTSPASGYTLWQAQVSLIDSATATTSSINWATASIFSSGYSGTNGASARVMYSRIAGSPTPISGTVTVSGDNRPTGTQSSAVWGASFNVTWAANDPTPTSNNTLWQADGIYDPTANTTAWSTPYISNLKVGSLSAITVNTGGLTVSDYIKAGTSPTIAGTTMTGSGFVLNSGGTFALGNAAKNFTFNGTNFTINGDLVVTGNIVSNAVTGNSYVYISTAGSTSSSSYVDVPGATISLSNNSSSSVTVLILSAYTTGAMIRVIRSDGTVLAGLPLRNTLPFSGIAPPPQAVCSQFIDTSPPTGTVTYKVQVKRDTGQGYDEILLSGTINKK